MTPDVVFALFWAGVGGIAVGLVFAQWSMTSYLRVKAQPENRTAAKFGDEFFYIVPEHEYVEVWVRHAAGNFKK